MIRKYYSVVEILIALGVIALLITLIFPILRNAKDKGRKTECLDNLRQIGVSLNSYLENNKFTMPSCTMSPNNPPSKEKGLPGINTVLKPYLGDENVFLCPGDIDKKSFNKEGLSYEWASSRVNGKKVNDKSFKLLGVDRPILWDFGDFHGKAGEPTSKNYLYTNVRTSVTPDLK